MRLEIKNEDGETIFDSKCKNYYLKNLNNFELKELNNMIEICNESGDCLADIFLSRLPIDLSENN